MQTDVSEITAGNRPTLSGLVSDGHGREVPGATVTIYAKAYGQSGYSPLRTVTTDSSGRFSAPVGPTTQTAYVAQSGGISSRSVIIRVHSRITVSAPTPGAAVPARTSFSGYLTPSYPGVPIGLAVIRAGRYTYLGQGRVDASGRWAIAANLPSGTYPYVVYTSAHSGTLPASKSLTLTVRSSAPPS